MRSLQAIEDVSLELRAELDRKTISLRELLALKVGSTVPLSKPAGENVEIYATEAHIGSGEILVLDGKLGVRLTEIGDEPTQASESLCR